MDETPRRKQRSGAGRMRIMTTSEYLACRRLPTISSSPRSAHALDEDLGLAGDITTNATLRPTRARKLCIAARKPGVVAGLALAEAAFRALDPSCAFKVEIDDGKPVAAGSIGRANQRQCPGYSLCRARRAELHGPHVRASRR